MPDPVVQKIGKYEVQAELGQGGFGKVYRAFDPTVGRPVAIKMLTTEGDRDLLTRFRNEAAAAGNLKHKNIVTVHEFGEHNGRPFLVMELLEGQDLLQIIKDGVQLTLLQKMNIMDQVADGLDCAHRNGVIHRDIKPANIRVLPDGTVKIMDFGVARLNRERNETRVTQQGDLVGTILYMSPEQFSGSGADALSDVFAYGVTYYELLTGSHPFKSTDPARVMFKLTMEDPEPLRLLAPECPEGLEQVVNRALQKDRELRYQSLRDLRLDTEPLMFELQQARARTLLVEAEKLSAAGEFTSALSIIHEALELDPSNREVRHLREVVQRELQNQAVRSRVKTMLETAEEQLARRDFSNAIQTLELALKVDQTNARTRALLDAARAEAQRYKEAALLVAGALQDLGRGDLTAAAEKSSEAARLDPLNKEAERVVAEARRQRSIRDRLQKIDALRTRGDLDSCVNALRELASHHPDSREVKRALEGAIARKDTADRVQAAVTEANLCIEQSLFGDAIAGLSSALKEFPDEPTLLAHLAKAEHDLRALKRAEAIEKTVRTAETMRDALDFDGALREINGALLAFPEEVRLREFRAAVSTAKAAWERELQIKKTVDECNSLHANQRLDDALEAIQAGLRKYQKEPVLVRLEREVREELERKQRDEAARRQAAEGRRLSEEGRFQEAVDVLEKACGLYPEEAELQTLLGQANEGLMVERRLEAVEQAAQDSKSCTGKLDFAGAIAILEKALESWPGEKLLTDHLEATQAARAAKEREEAVNAVARGCKELLSKQRLAEALDVIQAGLTNYDQEPSLVKLEREVREQWELQQRAEGVRRWVEEGQRLLKEGFFQQAVQILEEANQRYSSESELQTLLKRAKEELKAHERREGVEQAARDARSSVERQDFARAVEGLENALKAWPGESGLQELLRDTVAARDAKEREALAHQERQQRAEAVRHSVEEGRLLLGEGRLEQAVDALKKSCSRYPEENELQTLHARANEELSALRRRDAVEKAALAAQGLLDKEEFEQAIGILEQALRSWPSESSLVALLEVAKAGQAAKERRLAVDQVLQQCSQLRKNHRLADALEAVQAGLSKFPEEPALVRAELEIRQQLERQARQEQEVRERAEAVKRVLEKGRRLLEQGRAKQAAELLEKACERYPEESDLRTLLVRANEELQAEQRQQGVEQAAKEAQGCAERKEFERAVQILEKALESWPQESRLVELLQTTKAARAAEERRAAINAVTRESNQIRENHRLAEALELIQAGLGKYPNEPALARLEKELLDELQAQQRAEAAKRSAEEGRRLLDSGQTQSGVEVLENAYQQYPEAGALQTLLAQAQQRLEAVEQTADEAWGLSEQKNFGRALALLDKALQSWPGESRLVELLQRTGAAKSAWEQEQAVEAAVRECNQLRANNQLAEALEAIRAGLRMYPEESALLRLEPEVRAQWQQHQRAEAVRRSAESGRRLLEEGHLQQAVQVLTEADEKYSGEGDLRTLLARAKEELAAQQRREAVDQAALEAQNSIQKLDYKRALQILEKAIASWPGEKRLTELLESTQAAQATREREQAVDEVLRQSAQLVSKNRQDKALKTIQAGLRKYPEEPALLQLEREIREQSQRTPTRVEEAAPLAVPVAAPVVKKPPVAVQSRLLLLAAAVVVVLAGTFIALRLIRRDRSVTLTLNSNIAGAAIAVGGKSCVLPDCALTLPAGTYQLTATKDGFKAISQALSLSKGNSELKVPLVFEPLPQQVQVNTNFASGQVFLDGRPAGALRDGQFAVSGVSPGAHTLRVSAGDAQFETEWRSSVGAPPELARAITAKNIQATVIANLGAKGTISCNCDVQTVKVDGAAVAAQNAGKQGVQVTDLKEGARRIGIGDRSLIVDVKPNPSLNVFLSLDREVGTLVIQTGEDNVKILIDGRPYHRLTEHGGLRIPLDVGQHAISVAKDGFRTSAEQRVDLVKRDEKQIAFVLTPMPAALEIAGALPGAQVKVDGRVVGDTGSNGSFRVEVSPGNHVVELTKEDYTPVRFSTEFTAGRTTRPNRAQVTLARVPKPPPPAPAAPPVETKPTEAQDWDRVRASTNPDELDDFIKKHPGGAHVEDARNRLSQLRAQINAAAERQAEQSAWSAVDKSNKAALQDYLSRYAAGAHAQDARGLIAGIDKQQADGLAAAQRLKEQKPKEPDQPQPNPAAADYQAIERTLSSYEAAYNGMDLKALENVWQGMPKNMLDATRREFGDAKAISFQIRPLERPAINGASATVNCTRTLSMTMKRGGKQDMPGERVKVTLARAGTGWLIQAITPY
jgi:serine/threonine protein kinase